MRDRLFIYKLLLPLIENEVLLPVSFVDRESLSEENLLGSDNSPAIDEQDWQPDFNALSCGSEQKEKKEIVDYSKTFLPSTLLEPEIKQ